MNDVIIRLSDVSFSYDGYPVLTNVNFVLRAEEKVGLVGPNGSGKTTLLHHIVGLLTPSSGRIEAFGKVRREEKDFHEVRARAGLMFQDPDDQLFSPTVAEDVAFGPLNLGKTPQQALVIVAETLDTVGLHGYQDRITHKLSAGEKRLVSMATVLAMKPDALLLDEPAAGLDEPTTQRVVSILRDMPLAMIIVSHDRRFLDKITHKTYLLADEILSV